MSFSTVYFNNDIFKMKTVFSRIMLYIVAVISYFKINANIVFLDARMQRT